MAAWLSRCVLVGVCVTVLMTAMAVFLDPRAAEGDIGGAFVTSFVAATALALAVVRRR